MKKIICFTDNLGSGGAQRQLVGLACLLHEQGYHMSVLLYYDTPFYKSFLDERGIESVVVGNTANPIKRIWALYKYFRKNHYDVVIAYQETPSLIGCLLKPFFRWHKLIVSERNTTQRLTLKDRLRFFLYGFADTVVPNSYSQANYLATNYPKLTAKVVTITNFVDTDCFVPVNKHCRGNRMVIVASNKPEKNFERFIEAMILVKRSQVTLKVEWYGISEIVMPKYQEIINNRDLTDVVTIHPPQKNIQDIYQTADYFCLPSLFEGFPNVLCEAMSCGLPVVCSSVCDNPYIVQEGANGYLFDPYDVSQMAESIKRITQLSDEEYARISLRNRAKSVQMFSMITFVEKYIAII